MYNVTNGNFLKNVTDSFNVTFVSNAKNMTNATKCDNVMNNYNCKGLKCKIPRVERTDIKDLIKRKIYYHSQSIIDRLYAVYRAGNAKNYQKNKKLIDLNVFTSNNKLEDISQFDAVF